MSQYLLLFRDSETSRTDAIVWYCQTSSWPMQLSMDSCRTSRRNMHHRSLREPIRLQARWQERLDHMSQRSLFKRRWTLLNILLILILMKSKKRSRRLNRFEITRSRWRVHLERRNLNRIGLTSPKPTRFLTCYCRKGWSNWSHITRSRRKRSSRIWSTTSGTMPRRMIQMSAKSFGSKFSWRLSKGSWSLKLPKGRWRSTNIRLLRTWWMWPETRVLLKPRFWHHHRPRDLGLLILERR